MPWQIWPQFVYRKGVSAAEVIEILELLRNYCYQDTKDDLLSGAKGMKERKWRVLRREQGSL